MWKGSPITAATRLAPNFTFGEMVKTNHRVHIEENFQEGRRHVSKLAEVAAMLQVVRAHFGAPVLVGSGYRVGSLNHAIGGSVRSQHTLAEAADFGVVGVPLVDVFDWIRLESGLKFGQVILEGIRAGHPTWIHLSLGEPYRDRSRCRQALTWNKTDGYRRIS